MRLALIGVGLIGGSFAGALRAAHKVDHIVGFDSRQEAVKRAVDLGIVDQFVAAPEQAVDRAELVVIATPVGATRQIFRAIAPHLLQTAIVTDVGSAKSSVIAAARDELGPAFERFVPGHPIAGREHSGVEHSSPAMFANAMFVSTPVEQTSAAAAHYVEELWRSVGCRIERMTPEDHDDVFAAVSHLPHLLAFALLAQIAGELDAERKFAMAGSGFRDFTRIGGSSPALWTDICLANPRALAAELGGYRALLDKLQSALESGDTDTMKAVFQRAAVASRTHARA
ncbi:MAG: prephenate dehydrogenase/arogenate dehydrogenase family protein [Burkholderiaceae bacterium]|nr:prephenate dehydrogenase/arogenate dehydrogenase family protein [Burkholderiaceae bacterium]